MSPHQPGRRKAAATLAATTALLTMTALAPAATAAPAPEDPLHPTTRTHALEAMHGEAFAHAGYYAFAAQAKREHLPRVRTAFMRAAHTELHDHFTKEARLIGFVRGDAANLRDSIAGEREEATVLYPRFAAEARRDGDLNAARLFTDIARDEARHARTFRRVLNEIGKKHEHHMMHMNHMNGDMNGDTSTSTSTSTSTITDTD